jgi:ubiquinone/menaquinone biosynthesis C-methylase UbiE
MNCYKKPSMADLMKRFKILFTGSLLIFVLCCSIQLCYGQSDIKYSKKEKQIFENEFSKFKLSDRDTLVDIGAGSGINDELIFKFYPNAYFILEDIDAKYLKESKYYIKVGHQKKYFKDRSVKILGTPDSVPLPSEKYKNILCRTSLHEFSNPDKMLQEIKRIISVAGQLIIVEGVPEFEGQIQKTCGKKLLTKAQIITLLEANGFKLISADLVEAPYAKNGGTANLLRFKK